MLQAWRKQRWLSIKVNNTSVDACRFMQARVIVSWGRDGRQVAFTTRKEEQVERNKKHERQMMMMMMMIIRTIQERERERRAEG